MFLFAVKKNTDIQRNIEGMTYSYLIFKKNKVIDVTVNLCERRDTQR
jgi:hypothetical protein